MLLESNSLYVEQLAIYNRSRMITEFAAAVGTIKTSVDLLRTLHNASEDEKVRSAVFEIQNDLLSLQSKLFEANERFEEQLYWFSVNVLFGLAN
jgi:cob(I)alamin adenosyltransferase